MNYESDEEVYPVKGPFRTVEQSVIATASMFLLFLLFLPTATARQQWELVWSDEFNSGSVPDPVTWKYDVGGGGWGNQESQFYTDARPENARVENGSLVIEARKEAFSGKSYTSARLVSRPVGDITYGRVDIRAKLPSGRGTWPALWMLSTGGRYGTGGWPDNGEIDIMEAVGFDPGVVHANLHMKALNSNLGNNPGASLQLPDAETAFHVYSLVWTPKTIAVAVDDHFYFTYSPTNPDWTIWPYDQPFHLLLNIAIGGTWGGQQGIDDGIFPAKMLVDYVHVFKDTAGPPVMSSIFPSGSRQVTAGDSVRFDFSATDASGILGPLRLYQRDGLLAESESQSFQASISDLAPGCYEVHGRAEDSDGWTARTDTVALRVGGACVQAPYLMHYWHPDERVEAEYYDLGGAGEAFAELDQRNSAGTIRLSNGVDLPRSNDLGGGFDVGETARREWVEYSFELPASGDYVLRARLSSQLAGSMNLAVDGVTEPMEFAYPSTINETVYRDFISPSLSLSKGVRRIRLVFQQGGLRVNWIRLESGVATAVESVGHEETAFSIDVYPNPVTDELMVSLTHGVADGGEIALVNLEGREIDNPIPLSRTGPTRLDLSGMPAGVYFVIVRMGSRILHRSVVLAR